MGIIKKLIADWFHQKKEVARIDVTGPTPEQIAFEKGREQGYREGKEDGMNFIITHSRDLTVDEFEGLVEYLKKRNMVIAYNTCITERGVAVRVDITKDKRPFTTNLGHTFLLNP